MNPLPVSKRPVSLDPSSASQCQGRVRFLDIGFEFHADRLDLDYPPLHHRCFPPLQFTQTAAEASPTALNLPLLGPVPLSALRGGAGRGALYLVVLHADDFGNQRRPRRTIDLDCVFRGGAHAALDRVDRLIFWRSRMRDPAGTCPVNRTRFEP